MMDLLSANYFIVCSAVAVLFSIALYCVECRKRAIKLTRELRKGFERHSPQGQQASADINTANTQQYS